MDLISHDYFLADLVDRRRVRRREVAGGQGMKAAVHGADGGPHRAVHARISGVQLELWILHSRLVPSLSLFSSFSFSFSFCFSNFSLNILGIHDLCVWARPISTHLHFSTKLPKKRKRRRITTH